MKRSLDDEHHPRGAANDNYNLASYRPSLDLNRTRRFALSFFLGYRGKWSNRTASRRRRNNDNFSLGNI